MATGGATYDDWKEHLTCSLCLDIFTDPKVIPGCLHTYCLKCLEELASQHQNTFPCPECRAQVQIPAEGVAVFQSNRFLRSVDLQRARDGTVCDVHPKMEQDTYCVDCGKFVCPKCALKTHKSHTTQEIEEVAAEAKAQITEELNRLQEAESYMIDEVEAEKKEQQSLQDDKTALKKTINTRRAAYIAKVNKIHDDMLTALDVTCSQIEADVTKQLDLKQKNLDQLRHLKQQAQQAVSSGRASQLLNFAKDMKDGRGSSQTLRDLKTPKRKSSTRLIVSFKNNEIGVERNIEESMQGTPGKIESTSPEVTFEDKFTCGPELDIEIFSLCPQGNGNVLISYERKGLKEDKPVENLSNEGNFISNSKSCSGKVSQKALRDGNTILIAFKDGERIYTYSKAPTMSCTVTRLIYNVSSATSFVQEGIVSTDPFMTERKTLFSINQPGPQRAFDVDSSQQLFVVLADTQAPEKRQVHLYLRDQEEDVTIYTPPSPNSQPSDICFMTLGGQELLIVADEGTDSLHVVRVTAGGFTFLRYLAPGNTLLKQPTALNTDFEGRLWVACRGGSILTVTSLK